MRTLCIAAFLMVTAACAGRPSPALVPVPARPPVDADTLIRRGCYRCLEEAFAAATGLGATQQAFEAALLLALRSKELGLPPGLWLERARAILPVGPEWAAYLEIVTTQPRDPLSADRDEIFDEGRSQRRPRAIYEQWRTMLEAGPGSPLVRAYLDLSIACRPDIFNTDITAIRDAAVAAVTSAFGTTVPLLSYRAGMCGGSGSESHIVAARQTEPGFVDAEFELARRELVRRPRSDFDEAVRRFQLAREAFPDSPLIPATIGGVFEGREQWADALEAHEAVIVLVPTHADSLLGRTVSLSNLLRFDDARAAATRLIDRGGWHQGQAHYWRAWNQFQLENVEEARADADRAKTLWVNPAVLLLSGLIEWRLKRPESAEKEFQEAMTLDFGQCEAASYLGGVRLELRKWPESLAAFQQAQQCYDLSLTLRRQAVTALSPTPEDAAANAWQIAAHERAIAAAERRRAEAVQNVGAIQRFLAAPTR